MRPYPKAAKYTDLDAIYSQCSGPGAFRAAEFVADKLGLAPGMRVLDIGIFRGLQTCFLAKEYGCSMVAADPWNDDFDPDGDRKPYVDHLRRNAEAWGVADQILGVQVGVPDLKFAAASFDAAYSTTALEMVRGIEGDAQYQRAIEEVLRVVRPGALFGLAEPMHLGGPPPEDLEPLVSEGPLPFKNFLATADDTAVAFARAGFEVVESGYAPDARDFWLEFARHDWNCKKNPDGDPKLIEVDAGRWLSFGYVIGRKPTA